MYFQQLSRNDDFFIRKTYITYQKMKTSHSQNSEISDLVLKWTNMAEPNAKYPKIHEEYDLDLFQKEAVNIAKIAGKVCNSACNVPSVGLLGQY